MTRRRAAPLVGALVAVLSGCAAPGASVSVSSEAAGSGYFSLSAPAPHAVKGGLLLAGRVCRKARTTLLTPSRIRLEHVSANGDAVQTTHAYMPAIYRRSDQACARYSVIAPWTLADGETIRACFDRGRACPGAPPVKVVVPVTAP